MGLHADELTVPEMARLVEKTLAEYTMAEVQVLIDEHDAEPSNTSKLVIVLQTNRTHADVGGFVNEPTTRDSLVN